MGLALPAAWLRGVGLDVRVHDLSIDRLPDDALAGVSLLAVSLPMHTATRLALPVVAELRRRLPAVPICAYGLYAPLNDARLREAGATHVFGPECERDLVALALATSMPASVASSTSATVTAAVRRGRSATVPDRQGLPALERYAQLMWPDGHVSVVGAVEATRGCKHLCRHCPVVPIYQGRFHAVPVEVVLADIRAQVALGAAHITFADPDFFNGPTHAARIIDALHHEWPALTYDVTIKVEHLRRHDALLPRLRDTGCAFVTSAVESLDDQVLLALDKGHTRADVVAVAARCHALGLALSPTFVAFTPWTTLAGYLTWLDDVDAMGLVDHVAPVQWTLRLLVTQDSGLLALDDIRSVVGPYNPATLTHPWTHADERVDALQRDLMQLAGVSQGRARRATFDAIRARAAADVAGAPGPRPVLVSRSSIPYLTEPWYC